jgi:predicted transcriptional regulator
MEEDISSNMGFIMGNKQRERVVQILGSKGKMAAEKIAKIERMPLAGVKRILEELGSRKIAAEDGGSWELTELGIALEREMKKRV